MNIASTFFPIDKFAIDDHAILQLEYMPATNKTLAIARIPLLRSVSIHLDREAPQDLSPLEVEVTASHGDKDLFEPFSVRFPTLKSGRNHSFDLTDQSRVRPRRLPDIAESTEATLRLHFRHAGKQSVKSTTIRILAPNEWFNSRPYYQSLVTFSQPNDHTIVPVLQEGMQILSKATGSGAMQGYQAGPERAIQIAGAIFEALRERNIHYINPPASFENTGQKIRPSSKVLQDKMGTCIDLAVTYAAVAEQAGLHPAIFILRGHAIAGIFTSEDHMSRPVLYEEAEILNAVRSKRVIPIETVSYTAEGKHTFTDAVSKAIETLENTETFGLISVHGARRDGTQPIASSTAQSSPTDFEDAPPPPTKLDVSKVLDKYTRTSDNNFDRRLTEEPVPARIDQWKKELLDLSFNNRLLNLRPGNEVLELEMRSGMLAELDDIIHAGSRLTLSPYDEITENRRLQGYSSIRDFESSYVTDALIDRKRVYIDASESRYKNVFTNLRREVRTLLEETGSANLYLTLGSMTLQREQGVTAEAPLFLVPVTLSNRSGRSHFEIEVDTSQMASPNYCLVEWLRQRQGINVDALAHPPLDSSGLDIEAALTQISAQLIDANLPYTVNESSHLIIAKFSTYGMWKDLNDHWEQFMKAPVFRHIALTPGEAFDDPAGNTDLRDIDVHEEELPLPIPADGAQLKAITAAAQGRSFVLEGPPGTGKSQTITNLIAHCMAQGKSVLFVAEKQAALEVVAERLKRVGLEAFTLNLHGQDQNPTSIREQLKQTIDAEIHYDGQPWEFAVKELASRLEPLSNYPNKIHDTNAVGDSLWGAAAAKIHARPGPTLHVEEHYVRSAPITRTEFVHSVRELAKLAPTITPEVRQRWSFVGPQAAGLTSTEFLEAWHQLEAAREKIEQNPDFIKLADVAAPWEEILQDLEEYNAIPEGQRIQQEQTASARNAIDQLRILHANLTELAEESSELRSVFSQIYISDGPYQQLLEAADAATKGFFGKKKRMAAYTELLRAAVSSEARETINVDGSHSPERIRGLLRFIEPVRSAAFRMQQQVAEIPELGTARGLSPFDIRLRSQIHQTIEQLESQLKLLRDSPWLHTLESSNLRGLIATTKLVPASWQAWLHSVGTTQTTLDQWRGSMTWIEAWLTHAPGLNDDVENYGVLILRRASEWQTHSSTLISAGLKNVVSQLESAPLRPEDSELAVIRGIADASIRERISTFHLEDLGNSLKAEQLEALQNSMERVRKEALQAFPAKLLARRPYKQGRVEGKVGELRRLLDAQRNARSFRSLFAEYGDEIQTIAPCFFVSPASLATYLEPGTNPFDVVVFDEASQITVDQAMGALGRAQSAVIVGDSKQMPPTRIGKTNFEADDSDEDENAPEDLESILAEAVESQIPRLWLTWHYRSQDESLIAFSNERYYDNKLASLPTPGAISNAGIELRRVAGQFQRTNGKGHRTNRVEAEAIVEEIGNRLNNPLTSNESIGVVTFNIQQRNLIMDLLDDSSDPLIHSALTQQEDAIFVKNLENVQGDERDVILFSTAFSRTEDGSRMPLNFGPLSRRGGEKRLNVAITRARRNVVVFSSFDPHDIDLARTKSKGMADLRAYMELARDGAKRSLVATDAGINQNVIRDQIAERLIDRGWSVETNYGLSSFTLDLVVKPQGSQHWHLAVLLDGPRWAQMPTVADRDLTPELLEPLMSWAGVMRIWLPEWLRGHDFTVERIEQKLAEAADNLRRDEAKRKELEKENEQRLREVREKAHERAVKEENARKEALAELEAESGEEVDELEFEELMSDLLQDDTEPAEDEKIDVIQWDVDEAESTASEESPHLLSNDSHSRGWENESQSRANYIELAPIRLGDRDEISGTLTKARLEECRTTVEEHMINVSGPVLLSQLQSVIAQSFNRSRTSKSLNKNIDRLIPRELIRDDGTGSLFVWPRNTDPEEWATFRISHGERRVDEIPLIEIQNAMQSVVENMDVLDEEDLHRKTIQIFGLKRLTSNTTARLQQAQSQLNLAITHQ